MDPEYIKRIDNNIVALKRDLLPDEYIFDWLCQKEVLHEADLERIQLEPSRLKQNGKLINILKTKHGSYPSFYKALKHDHEHLADLLGPPSDSTDSVDPVAFLKSTYEESSGCKVPFGEIKRDLVDHTNKKWSLTAIKNLVKQAFPYVEILDKAKVKSKDRLQKWYAKDIRRRDSGGAAQAARTCDVKQGPGTSSKIPGFLSIKAMSTEQLQEYLAQWAERENIDKGFLDTIKREDIDGQVFCALTEEWTKDLFSSLTFGHRTKLFLLSKQSGESEVKCDEALPHSEYVEEEYLAEFNKAQKPTDSYKRHAIVHGKLTSVANMIDPVNWFVPAQDVSEDKLLGYVAHNAVKFAAACMNRRTNGTIHFGISEEGEIQGIRLDRNKCNAELSKALKKSFYPEQHSMVERCVRPARFVDVIQAEAGSKLYVVEVDVVPLHSVVGEEAFFVSSPKKNKPYALFEIKGDTISELQGPGINKYMVKKSQLSEERHQKEEEFVNERKKARVSNLAEDFVRLFCAGNDTLEGSMCPLLICGKPDQISRNQITEDKFDFLRRIEWQIIMDLDDHASKNSLYGVYEENDGKATRVLMSDEFDPRASKDNSARLEEVSNSSLPPWIFLNGYSVQNKEPYSPPEWKARRFTAFKEVLRHFYAEIPEDRAIVMILLLSKDSGVLADILADEICTKFPDHWLVVAEDDTVAVPLKRQLAQRNILKSVVEERFIVGIRWKHLSELIKQLKGPSNEQECFLPTSTGAPCHLRGKIKSSLTDLDILSLYQCEHTEFEENTERFKCKEFDEEIRFYKGGEVSWWNFFFKNQVCQRRQYVTLRDQVRDSLDGDIRDEGKVGRVHLYHQPGAGCTTLSKNVLWEYRRSHRCCMVRQISDQTCDQITKLYSFEEGENPRPVLVLVDNLEEEKVDQLCNELEEVGRQLAKGSQNFGVFCVLIICYRRMKAAAAYKSKWVWLTHKLHQEELSWFKGKNDTLEKYHKEKTGPDPNTLIAFNILKENFNQDYIERTVEEFNRGITDHRERSLLKYISLINSFDIDFKPVPLTCFDPLMAPGTLQKGKKWETQLSSSVNVLLVQRPTQCLGGKIQGLRVSSTILSRVILDKMLSSRETLGDAMIELLHSPILKTRDNPNKQIQFIMKNLIKKRAWIEPGKSTRFSPLIEEIREKESTDVAVEIMDIVFEQTDDPMITQQIARVYIEAKNWDEACKYARICTRRKPQNSFVWDTYGQVFKRKLQDLCNKNSKDCTDGPHECTAEELEAIQDGFRAIEIFRKEQEVSRKEKTLDVLNTAGYFGEVQVTTLILDLLQFLNPFKEKEVLHRFLVEPGFYPPEAMKSFGDDICKRLKWLSKESSNTLAFLEEDFTHLKDSTFNDDRKMLHKSNKHKLITLREHHLNYFGEEGDQVPKHFREEEAVAYRQRRVSRLIGCSLGKILDVRVKEDGKQLLLRAHSFLLENVRSEYKILFDYKRIVSVVLTLSVMKENCPSSLRELIQYSQVMFDMIGEADRIELEAYLYFVMLNWPMEDNDDAHRCPPGKLTSAIQRWREDFYKKYPAQHEFGRPYKKKETTIFHLGNKTGLNRYTHFSQLKGGYGSHKLRAGQFWTAPETVKRLQIHNGTLIHDGGDVEIEVSSTGGNVSRITIPSGMPIFDRSLWNKRVFFSIGFGWSGPKAYGICGEDPRLVDTKHRQPPPRPSPERQPNMYFNQHQPMVFANLHQQLKYIDTLKQQKRSGVWLTNREMAAVRDELRIRQQLQAQLNQAYDETQLPYWGL